MEVMENLVKSSIGETLEREAGLGVWERTWR